MSVSTPELSELGDRPLLPSRHTGLLIAALMAVSVCQFLDMTIANVALPHMQTSLDASIDTASWILTSFIIAGAIFTPITGWLSDMFGSRNLFLWSTAGFLATSALCGMATSLPEMVVFRCLQGVCAALIGPMSQAIMFDINAPSKQARASAIWGMVSIVAPIVGPSLGGYLTDTLSWRWIFFVNLPVGIPALAIMWWLLPSRPIERRKLDLFGFSMLALSLASLQLMLDRGQQQDWFDSWEIIIELAVAISGFWIFVVHSLRTHLPLFHSALLRDRNFIAAVVLMVALSIANVGLAALLPTMYQNVYGYSVMDTGLLLVPRGIAVVMMMVVTNYLISRTDFRYLAVVGFLISAVALWTMTKWSLDQSYETIIVSSFIQGLGMGLIFVPMQLLGFALLPVKYRMEGAALMALFRNLGGSFGISVIVTMLARNSQTSHSDIAANVTADSFPGIDLSLLADRFSNVGGAAMTMLDGIVSKQALMIAYLDNFYMMFWVLLVIAPLPLIAARPRLIVEKAPERALMESH
jgi:DHA2 family multidrug resistance protein